MGVSIASGYIASQQSSAREKDEVDYLEDNEDLGIGGQTTKVSA